MTMEEISRGLTQARADQERRRKLDAMCSSLADERKEQAGRAAALKDALEKENLDVERLERGGVTRLLYQVLGQLEEKSEKEKREAAAARVAYESCLRQLEDIEGELRRLRAERDRLSDADARYRQFYEAKQARLTAEQPAIDPPDPRAGRKRGHAPGAAGSVCGGRGSGILRGGGQPVSGSGRKLGRVRPDGRRPAGRHGQAFPSGRGTDAGDGARKRAAPVPHRAVRRADDRAV